MCGLGPARGRMSRDRISSPPVRRNSDTSRDGEIIRNAKWVEGAARHERPSRPMELWVDRRRLCPRPCTLPTMPHTKAEPLSANQRKCCRSSGAHDASTCARSPPLLPPPRLPSPPAHTRRTNPLRRTHRNARTGPPRIPGTPHDPIDPLGSDQPRPRGRTRCGSRGPSRSAVPSGHR